MAREKKNKKLTSGEGFAVNGGDFGISLGALLGKAEPELTQKPKEEKKEKSKSAVMPAELKIPKVSLQKKRAGCGGKTVTVVTLSKDSNVAPEALVKELKKGLGCGARVEDGKIVLQGDIADRAAEWFSRRNIKTSM